MAIDRDVSATPGASPPSPDVRPQFPDGTVHDQLLREAVTALTAAARVTRTDRPPGDPAARRPCDWAEFVSLALAGAAANIGGIETILAGRPGSWESDAVRTLLTATVGPDEQQLLQHRTDPVVVSINVDDLMADLGVWRAYDDACDALQRRYDDLGPSRVRHTSSSSLDAAADPPAATPEQELGCEQIAELQDRLEHQRRQDWDAYGAALASHIRAHAAHIEGLRVPVVVHVDVDPAAAAAPPGTWGTGMGEWLPERLLHDAVRATPLPGHGRTPLERLEQGE